VRDVALRVHLRFFALGRSGKRDHPENARTYPLGHGLDRTALAGAVAPLEEDADLQPLVHHPLLELDELDMQPRELLLVLLPFQLAAGRRIVARLVGHWFRPFDFAAVTPSQSLHNPPASTAGGAKIDVPAVSLDHRGCAAAFMILGRTDRKRWPATP